MNIINKAIFGTDNCSDDKIVKRTLRADKVIGVGAAMVLFGAIAGFAGIVAGAMMLGTNMSWMIPAVLFGGGISSLGIGLPLTGWANSAHIDLLAECKNRQICPPGPHYYPHQFIDSPAAPAVTTVASPVLSEVFDPAAAVTLPERIRAMPAIKLGPKKGFFA